MKNLNSKILFICLTIIFSLFFFSPAYAEENSIQQTANSNQEGKQIENLHTNSSSTVQSPALPIPTSTIDFLENTTSTEDIITTSTEDIFTTSTENNFTSSTEDIITTSTELIIPELETETVTTTVYIRIEGQDETILPKTKISFTSCEYTFGTTTLQYENPIVYCALKKAVEKNNITMTISYSDWGMGIEEIASELTDWINSPFWLYSIDNSPIFPNSIDIQNVVNNDYLIFYTSNFSFPSLSKIEIPTTTLEFNTTSTAQAYFWDYDQYSPTATTTIFEIDDIVTTTENGILNMHFSTTGTHHIQITDPKYIRSEKISIEIIGKINEEENQDTSEENNNNSGNEGGDGGDNNNNNNNNNNNQQNQYTDYIDKAISYLINQQTTSTGSIGGSILSDWVGMAFSKYSGPVSEFNTSKNLLTDYIKNQNLDDKLTSKERKTLALYALDTENKNQYIDDINSEISNKIDEGTLTDAETIFGILTLSKTNSYQETITKASDYLKTINLNFFDYQAPAIRALLINNDKDDEKIQELRNNLKNNINDNGGITGNTDSTAWSLEAIAELGELTLTDWYNEDKSENPYSFLLSRQNDNGSFSEPGARSPIMSTAYAILGLSYEWNPAPPQEPAQDPPPTGDSGCRGSCDTIKTPTTTEQIVTTTLEIIIEEIPTSTEEIIIEKEEEKNIVHTNVDTNNQRTQTVFNQPKKIIQPKKEIAGKKIEENTSSSIKTVTENEEKIEEVVEKSIDKKPLADKQKVYKFIFKSSSIAGAGLLLYLAWKFAKTLL